MNNKRTPTPEGLVGELQSEVAAEAAPLLEFITRHVRVIVGAIVLLIATIVATGAYQWYTAKNTREVQLQIGKVLGTTQGADRIQALEAILKDAPSGMQQSVRMEVGLAALEMRDFDKVAQVFGELAKADSGPTGVAHALTQSDALLQAGKAGEALAVLDALERTIPENMHVMLLEMIASAAEVANNPARAISAYESIIAADKTEDSSFYQARVAQLMSTYGAAKPQTPETTPENSAAKPAGESAN